jgi:hypothetical protein
MKTIEKNPIPSKNSEKEIDYKNMENKNPEELKVLMDNNYLFDKNFINSVTDNFDYNKILKPFNFAPQPVYFKNDENNENNEESSIPEIFQNNYPPSEGFPNPMMQPQGFPNPMMQPQGFPNPMMQPQGFPNPMMQPQGFPNPMLPPQQSFPNPMLPPQQSFPNPMIPSQGFPNSMNGMQNKDLPEFLMNIYNDYPDFMKN